MSVSGAASNEGEGEEGDVRIGEKQALERGKI